MAVGKWLHSKVIPYTQGTTQTGVILNFAVNAKTTLGYLKDAILSFGDWTWDNNLSYISDTGLETTEFITYYTTLRNTAGAKLWIGYSVSGCQLHYSCFSSLQCGKYATGPTITLSDSTTVVGSGWGGGFMMSMIPAGSANEFGTPNSTDNSWLPTDATPIVAHLAVFNEAYAKAATMSTTAKTPAYKTEINIQYQDSCFLVSVFSSTYGTITDGYNVGFPKIAIFMVGKIFENTSPLDQEYYSKYGWWTFSTATRDSLAFGSTTYGLNRTNKDLRNKVLYNGIINATLPSTQTDAGPNVGTLGFFKANGEKFNLNGPNGYYFAIPNVYYENISWICDNYTESIWSTISTGICCPSFTNGEGVTTHSGYKGVLRSDLIRYYGLLGSANWNINSIPPRGSFVKEKNFVMGPNGIAFGWNPTLLDDDCPWHKSSVSNLMTMSLSLDDQDNIPEE